MILIICHIAIYKKHIIYKNSSHIEKLKAYGYYPLKSLFGKFGLIFNPTDNPFIGVKISIANSKIEDIENSACIIYDGAKKILAGG